MSISAISIGAIVNGKYRIEGALARGGMGVVYRASAGGQSYAIKVMDARLVADAGFRERFDREVSIGSRLTSAHVVRVVDHGIDTASELPYLVMELLDGEALSDLVARRRRLSALETKAILAQVCEALKDAHDKGIVHRDLKPQNLFRTRSGVIKVLDFGLAKVASEWLATANSIVFGSPGWTAPEQFDTRAPITPATDVWALGLVAFYLLTGKQYWIAANEPSVNPMLVSKELYNDPIEPASQRGRKLGCDAAIPEGFDQWFAGCVERKVSARYPSAWSAYQALEVALSPKRLNMVKPLRGIKADISEGRVDQGLLTADTGPQPSRRRDRRDGEIGARGGDDEIVAQAGAELRARIRQAIQVVPSALDVAQASTRELSGTTDPLAFTPRPKLASSPLPKAASTPLSPPTSRPLPEPMSASSAPLDTISGLPAPSASATQPMSPIDVTTAIMASAPPPQGAPAKTLIPLASRLSRPALRWGVGAAVMAIIGRWLVAQFSASSGDVKPATPESIDVPLAQALVTPTGAATAAKAPDAPLALAPIDEPPSPPVKADAAPLATSSAPLTIGPAPSKKCPPKTSFRPGAGCVDPASSSGPPSPVPTAEVVGEFPVQQAQAAVDRMSSVVRACRPADEPGALRSVDVTFAPSGRVVRVAIDEGYNGSAGPCIRGAFARIVIDPFKGGPRPIHKIFMF